MMRHKSGTSLLKPATSPVTSQAKRLLVGNTLVNRPENPLRQPVWQPCNAIANSNVQRTAMPNTGDNVSNCRLSPSLSKLVQAKPMVGSSNDKFEKEADKVAERVMRMPERGIMRVQNASPQIRRVCRECGDDLQTKPQDEALAVPALSVSETITPRLQRQQFPEEEEELVGPEEQEESEAEIPYMESIETRDAGEMAKEDDEPIQLKRSAGAAPQTTPRIASNIYSLRAAGHPLPATERAFFESRFGHNFSNVRIHSDDNAAKLATNLNARAFTVGRNIAFGAGQYQAGTAQGKKLLAHELTHVIQQGASSPLHDSPPGVAHALVNPMSDNRSGTSVESGNANATIQRKVTVQDPKNKIPRPGGKGLDQTNATTVQNYLTKLCKSGSPTIKSTGDVEISKAFCTSKITKTPTGCGCVCDLVHSKHSWKIKVDDASWPHTIFDDRDAANGKKPGGTGGVVTTPSPNSDKLWGAATAKGKPLDIDPWLVLGHELCGHGWLGNFGKHGPDVIKSRGEGGHQETIKRENKLRAEHGIDLRGTYKDPYCGESYWRDKKKPKNINWSSFLDVCKNWRKTYNKKNKTKYKISDKIP